MFFISRKIKINGNNNNNKNNHKKGKVIKDDGISLEDQIQIMNMRLRDLEKGFEETKQNNEKLKNFEEALKTKDKKILDLEEKNKKFESEIKSLQNRLDKKEEEIKEIYEISDYLLGQQSPEIRNILDKDNKNIKYIINKINEKIDGEEITIDQINYFLISKKGKKILLLNEEIINYLDRNKDICQEYCNNNIITRENLIKFNNIKTTIKNYMINTDEKFDKYIKNKKKFIFIPLEDKEFYSKDNDNIYYFKYINKCYIYFSKNKIYFDFDERSLKKYKLNNKEEIIQMIETAIIHCMKNIEISGKYNWENEIKNTTHKIKSYNYTILSMMFQDLYNKKVTDGNYINIYFCFNEIKNNDVDKKFDNLNDFKNAAEKVIDKYNKNDILNDFLYLYSFNIGCECKKQINLDIGFNFIYEIAFNNIIKEVEQKNEDKGNIKIIPKEITIYNLLDTTKEEKYPCKNNHEMTLRRLFITNPKYFMINTNIKEQINYDKKKFIIKFSNFEKLSLKNYIDDCYKQKNTLFKKQTLDYLLQAFIIDINNENNNPNIVAFCKLKNKTWYKYDPDEVEIKNIEQNFNDIPLLLIYKNIS